jgi:hypothetical protein
MNTPICSQSRICKGSGLSLLKRSPQQKKNTKQLFAKMEQKCQNPKVILHAGVATVRDGKRRQNHTFTRKSSKSHVHSCEWKCNFDDFCDDLTYLMTVDGQEEAQKGPCCDRNLMLVFAKQLGKALKG